MEGAGLHRPTCGLFSGVTVYARDLSGIWAVDKNAAAFPIELEALGMRFESDGRDLLLFCGIDDGQATAAIADEYAIAADINTNVVGVVAEVNFSGRRIVRALIE